MRTLYFDCFSGASGNMILGALLDAGLDYEALCVELKKLNAPRFTIEPERVSRAGLDACHVRTVFEDQTEHRHLSGIVQIIRGSSLSGSVKDRSAAVFEKLASAEARVHGTGVEDVHFHEVGAMDAIIDIVGSSIGFELLGIEKFMCSEINLGSGFVEIAHGRYPVPPPAVPKLLKGMRVFSNEIEGELTTPTGAAILATVCGSTSRLPAMTMAASGYGAGTREYDRFPNVLRVMIGETSPAAGTIEEDLAIIETNLDDISPQILGYSMERLFEAGALDCWFTPIQMKKNRPGSMLSVLCPAALENKLREIIFLETTTLGVRSGRISRACLGRDTESVKTSFGTIEVKIAWYGDEVVNIKPEFEQVRAAAKKFGVPLSVVEDEVRRKVSEKRRGKAAG